MNYKSLNVTLGWLVFLFATAVYFITLEDTVSLWDCGEYITAAYKLEVGHLRELLYLCCLVGCLPSLLRQNLQRCGLTVCRH